MMKSYSEILKMCFSFKPVLQKWSGENNVEVKFKANPEPTDCHWKPSNDTFESCEISEAVTDGEYTVIFNSTLQKILSLEITNELLL